MALMLAWRYLEPKERNEVFNIINDRLRGIFDNGFGGPIFKFWGLSDHFNKKKIVKLNIRSAMQIIQKLERIDDEELRAQKLIKILPTLPTSLFPLIIKVIRQMEHEEYKSRCLAELSTFAGPSIRTMIYDILGSFEIDVFQFEGLRYSFPYLSSNELVDALNFAGELEGPLIRTEGAYWGIAPYLAMWCRAHDIPPQDIKEAWMKNINPPIPLRRDILFSTIGSLQPFTLSLIPGYGPSIANRIYESIVEVTEWWP